MGSDKHADDDLHVAVLLGDIDAAEKALQNGCNPNDIGLFGWNLLHEASVNGDVEILQLLLDNNGNPNKADELNNNTPLHYACQEGHENCIEILLEKGGDPHILNKEGKSCISMVSHPQALKLLKKLGYKEKSPLIEPNKKKISSHLKNKSPKTTNTKPEQKISPSNKKSNVFANTPQIIKTSSPDIKKQMAWQEIKSQGYGSMSSLNSSTCSTADDSAGTFTLSFQYNSKNKVFKVRVWEIILTSLLDTSQLSKDVVLHLFLRTAILPHNEYIPIPSLKRKSETILLRPGSHSYACSEKHCESKVSWSKREAKIDFKNSLSIEYDDLEKEMTLNSSIQISLCVRLKAGLLSNKNKNQSPVIAGLHLRMNDAIKTIMKTEYCTERHDIAGITRQSLPLDIIISGETNSAYYSDPNVQCDLSSTSNYVVDRSASDGDLQNVNVHQYSNSSSFVDLSSQEDVNRATELEAVNSHSSIPNSSVKVNVPHHDIVNKLRGVKIDKHSDRDSCNKGSVKVEMKSLTHLHARNKASLQSRHHRKSYFNLAKETSFTQTIKKPGVVIDEEHLLGSPTEKRSFVEKHKESSNQTHSSSLFTRIDESQSPSRTRRRLGAYSPSQNRHRNLKHQQNNFSNAPSSHRITNSARKLIQDDRDLGLHEEFHVDNPCYIKDDEAT